MLVVELWERIAIDITGKHPKSRNGNEYMLTVMDNFSKWAEAYPLRDHNSPTVVKVLVEQLCSRFGMPYQLLSNMSSEFGFDLFLEMCRWMDIDKIRISPYRPACNGMLERYHRTLNSMLGKIVEENQRDCDTKVQFVMIAYRASVHEATGYTPNILTLGRGTRAPLDIVLGPPKEEIDLWDSHDSFVADQQERVRIAYATAVRICGVAPNGEKQNMNCELARKKSNLVREFGITTHAAGLDVHRSGRGTT